MVDIASMYKNLFLRNEAVVHYDRNSCPNCGEMENFTVDDRSGDSICLQCGCVVGERLIATAFDLNAIPAEKKLRVEMKAERILGKNRKDCRHLDQYHLIEILQRKVTDSPQINDYIAHILNYFSEYIQNMDNTIGNCRYYLSHVPKTLFNIKKHGEELDWKGFRMYEIILTIYYYLSFKAYASYGNFASVLTTNNIRFSMRRISLIKTQLEQIPLFREQLFKKTGDIQNVRRMVKQQYYQSLKIKLKGYVESITVDMCMNSVKKQIIEHHIPIEDVREKMYANVVEMLRMIKYSKISTMTIPIVAAFLIYRSNRGVILRENVAKVCGVCTSGLFKEELILS